MIHTNRKPSTIGEILTHEFLEPLDFSQIQLAEKMDVPPQLVNEICRGRRAVTEDIAIMLGRVFGNTPQFWLNLQQMSDLWEATHDAKR
ncbi:addiction module HigA family antidote [Modicisalibacter xianhensis]|uniref:Addiction module HigA family antidote n=1 Tax=Modicisalibacter xianhensis TaxID=442341 RepID=A0A4R8FYJ2_9GAMM|nr:HigA family addiction module antitoxin [Halomonas xianhensis]TDX32155.1 addiction module HigA family antidote [Halomonas xianhensis]